MPDAARGKTRHYTAATLDGWPFQFGAEGQGRPGSSITTAPAPPCLTPR